MPNEVDDWCKNEVNDDDNDEDNDNDNNDDNDDDDDNCISKRERQLGNPMKCIKKLNFILLEVVFFC